MRIKNADKFKSPSDMEMAEKVWQLRYGNKCDPAALEAVHALHNALNLKYHPASPASKTMLDKYRETFWQYVVANYEESWPRHDGTFFRKLADAMEVHQKVNDPAFVCTLSEIQGRLDRRLPIPTVPEMHRILTERDISTSLKTVKRIFDFFGIKPADAKRGPRPGTKQTSVHRSRR